MDLSRTMKEFGTFGPGVVSYYAARMLGYKLARVFLRTVGNVSLRPKNSDYSTFRQVYIDKQYNLSDSAQQERLEKRYEQLLAEGRRPVIIDAGANVGAASLWFRKVYPEALILAVEPDSENARLCLINVGDDSNTRVLEAAIGGESGTVDLVAPSNDMSWGIQTVRGCGGGVRSYSVAELVEMGGPGAALFIVKIDIEGFESDLFASHTEWVQDAAAIYIEPHDWMLPGRGSSQSMQHVMMAAGFEILVRGENLVFLHLDFPWAGLL
jgi:FkbM family methyltransferase